MKVAVVGGSLGGLTATLGLRRLQQRLPNVISSVDVFEKSPTRLTDGGAGIVLQPEVAEALQRYTAEGVHGVEVNLKTRQSLDKDGSVQSFYMPQPMTSWEAVWKRLRAAVPDDIHHTGVKVTGIETMPDGRIKLLKEKVQDGDGSVDLADVVDETYDFVVAADGAGSRIRDQLLPSTEIQYAGYVAYRGTLPVKEAPADLLELLRDSFTMYSYPHSRQHILIYLIPGVGGSTDPNDQRINWVWYRNKPDFNKVMTDKAGKVRKFAVPAGMVKDEDQVAVDAQTHLPPQLAKLVASTKQPYIQAIHDMSAERLVLGDNGRILLLGDAAGLVRPHTASGTSKAAGDAMDLADLLEEAGSRNNGAPISKEELDFLLAQWEKQRLNHIHSLEMRGRMIGDRHGKEIVE